jgi:DNA-binding XRE family transcriptional regulator
VTRAHGTAHRYHNGPDENSQPGKGCRCPACRRRVADLKNRRTRLRAYGQWEPYTDATGTRRRLEGLMYIGVPLAYLAGRLGMSTEGLRPKMTRYRKVTPATAAKVAALSRELHRQPPFLERTPGERRLADRTRRHARRMGWVPVAAWDDIDDPDASPVPGWDTEPAPAQRMSGSLPVAAAIRQARERAELSQRALAAEVGVTESYIQLLEYGKRTPSVKTWTQLELTLGPLGIVRDQAPEAEETADAA